MYGKDLDKVFQQVRRANFVRPEDISKVDYDMPLPIGYGQTISQPYTVRLMLEWLDAQQGEKVLDVGSGSGWTAALLSKIVGPKGKVYGVELIPELVKFGSENCGRIGVKNAEFFRTSDELGLPDKAPFDRILVSASARDLPLELVDQIRSGGKMVIPIKDIILEITKTDSDGVKIIEHPGFIFVPLIT